MLKKKFLLLISLLILLSASAFASGCEFNNFNSTQCPRFSSVFNTFNLEFTPQNNYDSFDARIYDKNNPTNQIQVSLDVKNKKVTNLNPFTQSGVYVLEVKTYNKGKLSFVNQHEYIFDNLQPAAPLVPKVIQSSTTSATVIGKTQEKSVRVIAEVLGKAPVEVLSSENEFILNLNNLNNGINYVKFYTISQNGLKSFPVERIVVANMYIENNYEIASSILISDLSINTRTYNSLGQYYTTKKNFYVTGTAVGTKGAEIYVNGQRAEFDGTNYGAFILLNKGQNNIIVQSGTINTTTVVNYVEKDFKFLDFNSDKVFSNDLKITGNTNVNLPFDIYVNGKFIDSSSSYINLGNSLFSFEYMISSSNFKSGKNYIYLQGYNNEHIEKIVYKDINSPVLENLNFENIANYKKLAFKITDDIAADDDSVLLQLGPYQFSSATSNLTGDIYTFDVSEISDGTYSYTLSVKDLTEKSSSISGSVIIDNKNTVFDSFSDENDDFMYFVGNTLFLKSGQRKLVIKPSRYVAFEKIYLDSIEQTNYEILENGKVILKSNFEKESGEIKFVFINNNHEKFEETFKYYTDIETPKVNLDYISNPYGSQSNLITITGEVIDSHFNFNTIKFNGENNFKRFGNYFETKIEPVDSKLIITGEDYSKNTMTNSYNGILTKDTTNNKIDFLSVSNYVDGSFLDNGILYSDNRMKNYIYDFSGFDIKKTYVENQFTLSLPQRNGLENLDIKGFESSGNLFEGKKVANIDSINPIVYLLFDSTTSKYKVIVDGTYSPVSIINITSSDIVLDTSACSDKVSFYSTCEIINDASSITNINVYAKDEGGNSISKFFELTQSISTLPVSLANLEGVYFSGLETITNDNKFILQGNYVLNGIANSVIVTNGLGENVGTCQFGQNSFVCEVTLLEDSNTLNVIITAVDGHLISNTITLLLDSIAPTVNILALSGPAIYDTGIGIYYINDPSLSIRADLDEKAFVKIILDDEEYLGSIRNSGEFIVNINITDLLIGKDREDIDLKVIAQDEAGNIGISGIIKLIYNRVAKVFVDVNVE